MAIRKLCAAYVFLLIFLLPQSGLASLLVVAPHPDDDIITASGVIADAVNRGEQVTVVYITNGDISGVAHGLVRQAEAVDAQVGFLGTTENDLIFLGYPDSGLDEIYRFYPNETDVYTTAFGQSATYGNRGLGGTDYHTYRFGSPANYNRFNIISDLASIIDTYRPDHIFTTSEFDNHTDHATTYELILLGLQNVFTADPTYTPSLHKTIVWSSQPSIWPAPLDPATLHVEIPDLNQTTLVWADRESINVPLPMQDTLLSINPKVNAIASHDSQGGVLGFIGKFSHKDEIFWVENPMTAAAPPVVDAGPGISVAMGDIAQLDGSGSFDIDGAPLAYQWSQLSGPNVTLSDPSSATPTFMAPNGLQENTVLRFQLIVTNGSFSSIPDHVEVTVQTPDQNIATIASSITASSESIGSTQTAQKAIDGFATGWPVDYQREWASSGEGVGAWIELAWNQVYAVNRVVLYDRPNTSDQILSATLSFSDGSTLVVGPLDNEGMPTVHTFATRYITSLRLTVDTVSGSTINVGLAEIEVFGGLGTGVNLPPTAHAGQDQIVLEGASVQLDGSGSSDPNNDPLTYQWTQVAGSSVELSDATLMNPSFTAPTGIAQNEQLVFDLVVDDGSVASIADSVIVTVSSNQYGNIASNAVVTASSENTSTTQTAVKAIDGFATGYPVDYTREWATLSEGAGAWLDLNWSSPYTIDRIVLYDRPNGADHIQSATLSFSDGSTVSVGALDNAGGMTEVTFAPRTVQNMRLTVVQTSSSSTNIGLAEIEVYGIRNDGINLRPTADAGPDQSVSEADLVTLDGSLSSDPNGDPITYQWVQVSGIPVTLSASTTASPGFAAPSGLTQSEVLVFELVVDDGIESSLPDSVSITVASLQNTNVAPTATVTASSENTSTGQTADKAVDTVPSGYPNDYTREWATAGEGAGAWIELAWSSAQTVDRVLLYDRPNGSDQIVSGTLTFSDGSSVAVGTLDNSGGATEIFITPRTVTSMRLTVGQASPSTLNVGLAEIEVFATP